MIFSLCRSNSTLHTLLATVTKSIPSITLSAIQASWVTQGPKMGAASLAFGVNDMGSTMIEENVVSAAGTVHSMNEPEIVAAIRERSGLAVEAFYG